MKVKEINLSSSAGFLEDYISERTGSECFLDYTFQEKDKFRRRSDELLSRSFKREQLADYFTKVHANLSYSEQANHQIVKLRKSNSVVVVGGQQAGLLTGPFYTVYKAMSIIALAKQQEEQLNIPVVPIFWVAGEDHDLDEIRYVFKEKDGQWKKHMYAENDPPQSASNVKLKHLELERWLNDVFASLPETNYTKSLLEKAKLIAAGSTTYVDFFIKTMNWFFGKEGLLFLDSHDPEIRNLEIPYFEKLINDAEKLQIAQQRGAQAFANAGYGTPIETDQSNAHLFLEIDNERKRLDFEDNLFIAKGTNHTFTKENLLTLLHTNPNKFSNNVVTRPLMQEWLLPVIAFVSGPGELLYWATLKDVFQLFEMRIPPIIPRMHATILPVHIEKWLAESNNEIEPFLEGRMEELRENWLKQVNTYPINEVINEIKQSLNEKHLVLQQLANEMDPTLGSLTEKNAAIIEHQLSFIEQRMQQFVRQSHEQVLSKYNETGKWLFPLNRPQERVLHPLILLNMVGIDEFRRFLSYPVTLDRSHKAIYL
ncbi:bacillithiol biosynthesis cysteine-adding enzyme BshC [bacterium LRH843]|nr:bacillithiol biosynthesis cysteine-adding enzyme BshC [bacterium LRH843]